MRRLVKIQNKIYRLGGGKRAETSRVSHPPHSAYATARHICAALSLWYTPPMDAVVRTIFQLAAPEAARFLASIAAGEVPASVQERLVASRMILDRSIGTPIPMDVADARATADAMIERIKRAEAARMNPPRPVVPSF